MAAARSTRTLSRWLVPGRSITNSQYTIRTLLALTATVAVFVSLALWVLQTEGLQNSYLLPVSFLPTGNLLFTGILITPVIGFLSFTSKLYYYGRFSPRPFTSLIFIAVFSLAPLVNEHCLERHAIAMASVSLAVISEAIFRGLPRQQLGGGVLAFVTTISYFWTMLCAYMISCR